MTSMMFEFKPTMSDSDSDCDIPVPDIARADAKKDRRRADVERLVGTSESVDDSLGSPSIAAATAHEVLQQQKDSQLSTRPLGAIEIQQLQVGELSAALLCSSSLGVQLPPSMISSTTSSTGGQVSSGAGTGSTVQTAQRSAFEGVKIRALGRTFRTNNVHMRDLLKRKALTLPQSVRYDDKADIFYVDCSAEVFEEVFDFFRTGDLHLPKKVCIEKSLREMRRLNVFPNMLAPCCFARYDRFRAQKEAMKIWYEQLVKDPADEQQNLLPEQPGKRVPIRMQVWNFLENPFSSKFAIIYSWITIIMVALSIAGFIVETLPQIDVLLNNYKFVRQFGDLVNLCNTLANPTTASSPLLNDSSNAANNGSDPSVILAAAAPETTTGMPPVTPMPCPVTYDASQGNRFSTSSINNKSPPMAIGGDPSTPGVAECYIAMGLWFTDYFAAAFFTLDLLVRLVVSPSKVEFFKSRLNLVDCMALVPFYVELVFSILTRMAYNQGPTWRRSFQMWEVLEVFRSLRLLRIFRLAKWNYGLNVLYYTARAIVGPMSTLLTICIIGILFFGTIMYYIDARDRFTSIPISIYWAAITMTTVGYGDITPKTGQGCLVAALCASCGILVIGFVLPIVTSKFMFYYQHIKMGRYYKKMARRSLASSSSMSSLEMSKEPSSGKIPQRRMTSDETDSLLMTTAMPHEHHHHSRMSSAGPPPPIVIDTAAPVSGASTLNHRSAAGESSSGSAAPNSISSFRKSTSSDESLQPIPENRATTMPLIAESDLSSLDGMEPPKKTPRSERALKDPFIPSADNADETDYRMWNGKIDSVH